MIIRKVVMLVFVILDPALSGRQFKKIALHDLGTTITINL